MMSNKKKRKGDENPNRGDVRVLSFPKKMKINYIDTLANR